MSTALFFIGLSFAVVFSLMFIAAAIAFILVELNVSPTIFRKPWETENDKRGES